MSMTLQFLIGVDGGGTGTRVLLADLAGRELARAVAGPSALALGLEQSWRNIMQAIDQCARSIDCTLHVAQCAIGLGLSGVHNPELAEGFARLAPRFGQFALHNDGYTTLLGAHGGQPGAIIAIGTGVVGEAWFGGADARTVSGWGFPTGDEGSGAWLGLQAVQLAQKALDGRAPCGPLAQAVIERLGGNRAATYHWLAQSSQTAYAELARLVLACAGSDPAAAVILHRAGEELAALAAALDPQACLPLALCGGLGEAMRPWLPAELAQRAQRPQADSATGALLMIRQALQPLP